MNHLIRIYKIIMPKVYKIWSHNRALNKAICVSNTDNILHTVMEKGSNKLNIKGKTIVLEKDDTEVDEDEIMEAFHDEGEVFIILQENEFWQPTKNTNIELMTDIINNGFEESNNHEINQFRNEEKLDNRDNQKYNVKFNTQNKSSEGHADATVNNNNFSEINDFSVNREENETTEGEEQETRNEQRNTDEVEEPRNEGLNSNAEETVDNAPQSIENQWLSFKISWEAVSKHKLKELESSEKSKRLIAYMVNEAVDQMRTISTTIPFMACNLVAKQLTDKYPAIFQDKNSEGKVMGSGFVTIAEKIKNRNKNLSRIDHPNLSAALRITSKTIRKKQRAEAGCSKWQPQLKQSIHVLEGKRVFMQKWIDKENKNNSDEEVSEGSENEPPSANDINEMWPILLEPEFLLWQYQILMGHSIDNLCIRFQESSNKIFAYAHANRLTNVNEISDEEVLRIIGNVFKEKIDLIFLKYPEVESVFELQIPPNVFAWVACVGNQDHYSFFLENRLIRTELTFMETLKLLFASYFVFNKNFPKSNSITFDFIQRYLLSIEPINGNKAWNSSKSKNLVASFANKLDLFHVPANTEDFNPDTNVLMILINEQISTLKSC
ncbi:uncharacterized protein LOC122499411, partial [Leptopilina heterotoma]|uniref:uncharacterized protein LOC122499411 n=1 Tax=Leptopilina heterotoma TaxID=63436 RepID=UPI001CA87565